jgi:hypothetical protein
MLTALLPNKPNNHRGRYERPQQTRKETSC